MGLGISWLLDGRFGFCLSTQESLETPERGSNALSNAMQRHTKSRGGRLLVI